MRVMRVIAGNVSYYIGKVSVTNTVIGVESYPPSPASPANQPGAAGPSSGLWNEGNANPELPLGRGLPA